METGSAWAIKKAGSPSTICKKGGRPNLLDAFLTLTYIVKKGGLETNLLENGGLVDFQGIDIHTTYPFELIRVVWGMLASKMLWTNSTFNSGPKFCKGIIPILDHLVNTSTFYDCIDFFSWNLRSMHRPFSFCVAIFVWISLITITSVVVIFQASRLVFLVPNLT